MNYFPFGNRLQRSQKYYLFSNSEYIELVTKKNLEIESVGISDRLLKC